MKRSWILGFALVILFLAEFCASEFAISQVVPTPTPAATPAIPVLPAAKTPVLVDVVKAAPAPVTPAAPMAVNQTWAVQPVVIKDVDMAPPTWMQDVFVSVKSLPYIGPILTKLIQWISVLCAILTALCAFLIVSLKALGSVLAISNLDKLADAVTAFQNGKTMYWLKYASMFNAKKPVAVAGNPSEPAIILPA